MENKQNIINIGPKEANRRLMPGVVMGIIGLAIYLAFLILNVSIWWNLILFFPFMGFFIGYLQAKKKT